VRKIQQKDASAYIDYDRKPTTSYECDLQGLLWFYRQVMVLMIAALRQEILKQNHDDQVASSHYSISRTAELISRKYY
jgi:hypothetical protein